MQGSIGLLFGALRYAVLVLKLGERKIPMKLFKPLPHTYPLWDCLRDRKKTKASRCKIGWLSAHQA